tara:strand:+ start:677 stop:1750 length:1074 start_codon:yes stop_codon:yes gene_type:complete
MSIPISRPIIGLEEEEAVLNVLRSGMIAGGAKVVEFEEAFAKFVDADHAIAVNSGTSALVVGLAASGVGPGDEVIVPSFTFAATANAVAFLGAKPIFADVDPETYVITPETVLPLISEQTKGIMPVHLFGYPAPLPELLELATEKGLELYEDAAQSHGATVENLTTGAVGKFAAFSFYPTKNMTTGEGGMITTSDPEIYRVARLIRNQGMEQRYVHEVIGLNERMTDISASIGLVQLNRLGEWTERRRKNADFYQNNLDPALKPPKVSEGIYHVYHQYTICPPDRERTIAALEENGVGYGIYYPIPTHVQKPYADSAPSLPITEKLADEVLSIPVRPDLEEEERSLIVDVLNGSVSV